ncbi:MAG: hypothetical protein J7621_28980 [Niastella sp.]|nr:hypothetical protein [Niastella sp.]
MRFLIFSFLFLLLFPFLTIAQDRCDSIPQLPYKAIIAGKTDSITVDAILQAGKVQSSNPAFKVLSFIVGAVPPGTGCYSEAHCATDTLSPEVIAYIKRMPPRTRLYFDCVRVKNSIGKEYVLKSTMYKICAKLPSLLVHRE